MCLQAWSSTEIYLILSSTHAYFFLTYLQNNIKFDDFRNRLGLPDWVSRSRWLDNFVGEDFSELSWERPMRLEWVRRGGGQRPRTGTYPQSVWFTLFEVNTKPRKPVSIPPEVEYWWVVMLQPKSLPHVVRRMGEDWNTSPLVLDG